MKTKNQDNRLSLNKKTITKLNDDQLASAKGAGTTSMLCWVTGSIAATLKATAELSSEDCKRGATDALND